MKTKINQIDYSLSVPRAQMKNKLHLQNNVKSMRDFQGYISGLLKQHGPTVSASDMNNVLNFIQAREKDASKTKASHTGWFMVGITNCAGISNENILLAIKYVLVPLNVAVYDFKRSVGDDGQFGQFIVDSVLVANRLKRLKTVVAVLYTKQSLPLHIEPGLPLSSENGEWSADLEGAVKAALRARYNCQTQSLDLSHFHRAAELSQNFCALSVPQILKRVLALLPQELPQVAVLSLRDNCLTSLLGFATVAANLPSLELLDLGLNSLAQPDELKYLFMLRVQSIILEGNPLARTKISQLRRLLPKVQTIDGCPVQEMYMEPQRFFSCVTGALPQSAAFLKSFFEIYDCPERRQTELVACYVKHAVFSLTVSSDLLNISGYKMYNRNHRLKQSLVARATKLQLGCVLVAKAQNRLPATKHDINRVQVDVTTFSRELRVISVTGEFRERQDQGSIWLKRHFQRTFILRPYGGGWLIQNDMLVIMSLEQLLEQQLSECATRPKLAPIAKNNEDKAEADEEMQLAIVEEPQNEDAVLEELMPKLAINLQEIQPAEVVESITQLQPPSNSAPVDINDSDLYLEAEIDETALSEDEALVINIYEDDLLGSDL